MDNKEKKQKVQQHICQQDERRVGLAVGWKSPFAIPGIL